MVQAAGHGPQRPGEVHSRETANGFWVMWVAQACTASGGATGLGTALAQVQPQCCGLGMHWLRCCGGAIAGRAIGNGLAIAGGNVVRCVGCHTKWLALALLDAVLLEVVLGVQSGHAAYRGTVSVRLAKKTRTKPRW